MSRTKGEIQAKVLTSESSKEIKMPESPSLFEVETNPDGKIVDFLSGTLLDAAPEEQVRQRYLRILHYEYKYPKERMRREVPIQHGSDVLKDKHGKPVRADIVIYLDEAACAKNDQGRFYLVVECKAPNITDGYNQLVSYIFSTSAEGGVWFNGSGEDDEVQYYRRLAAPKSELKEWIGIPRAGEAWSALGRRKKSELVQPKDIKGLLRRCHNRIHGRGSDGEEEDLTMDMVRIMLAKAMDEESTDPLPQFYCTPEEYTSPDGIKAVAERINKLFENVKRANTDVFSPHERVTVGARSVADVVVELQDYQLLSDAGAEPPRVCRRLPFLRRWSDEQIQDETELFPGGARARRPNGVGADQRAFLAMGGDRVDRAEDRLHAADAA